MNGLYLMPEKWERDLFMVYRRGQFRLEKVIIAAPLVEHLLPFR